MNRKHITRGKGFSLIEVLVVITIICILTAIAVPAFRQYQARAKVQNVYQMLANFAQSLYLAYQKTGSFPSSVKFYNGTTYSSSSRFQSAGGTFGIYYFLYGLSGSAYGGADNRGIALGAAITGLT